MWEIKFRHRPASLLHRFTHLRHGLALALRRRHSHSAFLHRNRIERVPLHVSPVLHTLVPQRPKKTTQGWAEFSSTLAKHRFQIRSEGICRNTNGNLALTPTLPADITVTGALAAEATALTLRTWDGLGVSHRDVLGRVNVRAPTIFFGIADVSLSLNALPAGQRQGSS